MDKVFCDRKIKELEAQEEGLLEKLNDVKKDLKKYITRNYIIILLTF